LIVYLVWSDFSDAVNLTWYDNQYHLNSYSNYMESRGGTMRLNVNRYESRYLCHGSIRFAIPTLHPVLVHTCGKLEMLPHGRLVNTGSWAGTYFVPSIRFRCFTHPDWPIHASTVRIDQLTCAIHSRCNMPKFVSQGLIGHIEHVCMKNAMSK
jgi:hypothetical protein